MALLHNAILRGFNSIYLQAPHVKQTDYADFIGYSLTWYTFVKKHHDDEEKGLFPKVEEAVGQKGVLDKAFEEHGVVSFFFYIVFLLFVTRAAFLEVLQFQYYSSIRNQEWKVSNRM